MQPQIDMLRAPRLLALVSRARSTYWFLPSVVTAGALLAAFGLVHLDRVMPDGDRLSWAYSGGADGALALLSSVATATITVVSVTFSVMVVALTVSSQHFGPRLLNSFMCDNGSQLVLGIFTGTFSYCLVVLRTVHGGSSGGVAPFVPHLAVTGAVVLTLISVGMLIYYVHHVAVSMQVTAIAGNVARDLERAIDRLYPERIGRSSEAPAAERPPPEGASTVSAGSSGYLQAIDADEVLRLAAEERAVIWVTIRPGDFVTEGSAIARIHPTPRDPRRTAARLNGLCSIGNERTSHQDAAFVIQQLVEMALRALSPGVNEPFTAVTCVDRLAQGLCRLAGRHIPGPVRTDEHGAVRAVLRGWTLEELLDAAFDPISAFADRSAAVRVRLFEALERVASASHRREDRQAIARLGDRILAQSDGLQDEQRPAVRQAYERFRSAMDGSVHAQTAGTRRARP